MRSCLFTCRRRRRRREIHGSITGQSGIQIEEEWITWLLLQVVTEWSEKHLTATGRTAAVVTAAAAAVTERVKRPTRSIPVIQMSGEGGEGG